MRELVHEPMKTRSSGISRIGVPGARSMYFRARSSPSLLGSGTSPVTGATISGVVPQVTCGEIADASTSISRSNAAPSSVSSERHSSTGRGSGAAGRPSIHSKVTSSGAIIPARPPPSIVMLQTVIRPSMESASIAGPANSTTWPAAPETPIWPIVPRMRSFAVTPRPGSPV